MSVTPASVSDRVEALEVLPAALRRQRRLELLSADADYAGGTLAAHLRSPAAHPVLRREIIKGCDPAPKGFGVHAKRWIDAASSQPAGWPATSLFRYARLSTAPLAGSCEPAYSFATSKPNPLPAKR